MANLLRSLALALAAAHCVSVGGTAPAAPQEAPQPVPQAAPEASPPVATAAAPEAAARAATPEAAAPVAGPKSTAPASTPEAAPVAAPAPAAPTAAPQAAPAAAPAADPPTAPQTPPEAAPPAAPQTAHEAPAEAAAPEAAAEPAAPAAAPAAAAAEAAVPAKAPKPPRQANKSVDVSQVFAFLHKPKYNLTRASDLNATGACRDAVKKFCGDVAPGDGKLAKCLTDKVEALKAQKEASPLTPVCSFSLHRFNLATFVQSKPKNLSSLFAVEPVEGIREACREDAEKFCPGRVGFNLTSCLKRQFVRAPSTGSTGCKEKLFKVRMQQAMSMEFDPILYSACYADLENGSCAGVANVTVKRKACLKEHRKELSASCRSALFNNTMSSAEDLRLDQDVFTTCKADTTKFCKDEEFGEARMLMCLWDSQSKDGFSFDCKQKVNRMMKRSVEDYRLDFRVRTRCETEIDTKCKKQKALVDNLTIVELFGEEQKEPGGEYYKGESGKVLRCLKQHYRNLTKGGACREEVKRVIRVQAMHAGADPILARNCKEDIVDFCPSADPSKMHLCLRKHMEDLSEECREAEVLQGSLEAGSIALKPQLKAACRNAIKDFCKDVNPGAAQVIRCLQDNADEDDFPSVCKKAVVEDLEASNHDWRLKYGISHECEKDAGKLCEEEMRWAGGEVIKCLKTNYQKLETQGCKSEMRRFIRQGAKNLKLAPGQYQTCMADVQEYCKDVPFGSGRVHDCLLTHRYEISVECAAEEFENQKFRSEDIRMAPKAMSECKLAMKKHCDGVSFGGGKMWSCLEDKHHAEGFPDGCAHLVMKHMKVKHSEFELNPALAANCRADAERLCPSLLNKAAGEDFSSNGEVIGCLITLRKEIQNATCGTGVQRMMKQRISHTSLDPYKNDVCKGDIEKWCSDVMGKGNGKVYKCLREHLQELSNPCREVQEDSMEQVSEDARLSPQLMHFCKKTREEFCKKVDPGEHKMWSCLMKHTHEASVEPRCREALVAEMKKGASDVKYTPKLRRTCSSTLKEFSANQTCEDVVNKEGNWQVSCLTQHVGRIKDSSCHHLVRQMVQLQSADLRASPGMEKACQADIDALCEGLEPGGHRLHKCLQEKQAKIANLKCKRLVKAFKNVTHGVALFNYEVNKNCKNEKEAFCKAVPAGHGKVLTCLKLHEKESGFGHDCKEALHAVNGTSADALAKAARKHGSTVEEIQAWLEKHEKVTDKYGGVMLGGAVAFTALFAFSISYCVLKRKYNRMMYGATPDTAEV